MVSPTIVTPIEYQWCSKGVPVTGATNRTFEFPTTWSSTGAIFSVSASNFLNTVFSDAAAIVIRSLPLILSTATPSTVLPGSDVLLSVTAAGSAPLTYQWSRRVEPLSSRFGSVLVGETNACLLLTNVTLADSGLYTLLIENSLGFTQSLPVAVKVLSKAIESATALDATNLVFESSGHRPWFAETEFAAVGASAMTSGLLTDSQVASIQTRVTGAGLLQFRWRVSSELGADRLRLFVDDVEVAVVSGEVGWHKQSVHLTAADHVVRWTYSKDESLSSGQDAGWLDAVRFIDGALLNIDSAVRVTASQLRLAISGDPSLSPIVQASTNLVHWTEVARHIDFPGVWVLTNAVSSGAPQQYYRALSSP